MSKRNSSLGAKGSQFQRRKALGKKFMPEKKKEKLRLEAQLKRELYAERKRMEKEAPPVEAPLLLDAEDIDLGVGRPRKRSKTKSSAKMQAQREDLIAENRRLEQEKREQAHKAKQRKQKNKRMRKQHSQGRPVMKHVIGDLLQKIEQDKKNS